MLARYWVLVRRGTRIGADVATRLGEPRSPTGTSWGCPCSRRSVQWGISGKLRIIDAVVKRVGAEPAKRHLAVHKYASIATICATATGSLIRTPWRAPRGVPAVGW